MIKNLRLMTQLWSRFGELSGRNPWIVVAELILWFRILTASDAIQFHVNYMFVKFDSFIICLFENILIVIEKKFVRTKISSALLLWIVQVTDENVIISNVFDRFFSLKFSINSAGILLLNMNDIRYMKIVCN